MPRPAQRYKMKNEPRWLVRPDSRKRGNWVTPKINIYFIYTIAYINILCIDSCKRDLCGYEPRIALLCNLSFAFSVGEKKVYFVKKVARADLKDYIKRLLYYS